MSRENFFTTIGISIDPGNVVLSLMVWLAICRSGAALPPSMCETDCEKDMFCKNCKTIALHAVHIRRGRSGQKCRGVTQCRDLFLYMQDRWPGLRFQKRFNVERAGDILEAIGGILCPFKPIVRDIMAAYEKEFKIHKDDVKETVNAMGEFAKQIKILYSHACRDHDEAARVASIMATMHQTVKPMHELCVEGLCALCAANTKTPKRQSPDSGSSKKQRSQNPCAVFLESLCALVS